MSYNGSLNRSCSDDSDLGHSSSSAVELDLRKLPFCGRQDELNRLQDIFETCCSESKFQMVVIEGESGSGKSELASHFISTVLSNKKNNSKWKGVVVCRSKYDQDGGSFDGVRTNVNQLVDRMIEQGVSTWRERLSEDSRIDYSILHPLLPSLRKLMKGPNQDTRISVFAGVGDDQSLARSVGSGSVASQLRNLVEGNTGTDRLLAAVRGLLSLWSVHNPQPLIFLCDDLQWADRNSKQLFQRLLALPTPYPHLFIGTVRSPTEELLIHKEHRQKSFVHHFALERLTSDETSKVLAKILRQDKENMKQLGEILHAKTGGNAFVLGEFIRLLATTQLIHFSMQTYAWTWDIEEIASHTDVSEDIAELVLQNLDAVDPVVRTVLMRAAAIGPSTFESFVLYETINGTFDGIRGNSDLQRYLDLAVKQGFLEEIKKSSVYKFSHDKVKESVMGLLPVGIARTRIHYSIGKRLLDISTSENAQEVLEFDRVEDIFMLAMRHIGLGLQDEMDISSDDCQELVSHCVGAAELAMETASFPIAAIYLETGLSLLEETEPWREYYSIMLRLCSMLSSVYFSMGRVDNSEALIHEILSHGRSLEDKLPAYRVLIFLKMQHSSAEDAIKVNLSVIDELAGRRFPRNFTKYHILKRAVGIMTKINNMSDDEIMSLPDIHDPRKISLVEFLITLVNIAGFSEQSFLFALGSLECVQIALQHGFSSDSCVAFASTSGLFSNFGRIDLACRLAKLAIRIGEERTESHASAAKATSAAYCFSLHWKIPLQSCLAPTFAAVTITQREGDVQHIFLGVMGYMLTYFYSGLPLQPFELDLRRMYQAMTDYGQNLSIAFIEVRGQYLENLMGRGRGNPTDLTGSWLSDPDQLIADARVQKQRKCEVQVYVCRQYLAYHFEDLQLALKMSDKLGPIFGSSNGTGVFVGARMLYDGLTYLGRFQETRFRLYLKKADFIIRKGKKLVGLGCVNIPHVLAVLQAERLAVINRKKTKEVQLAFDKAIAQSARAGCLFAKSLANELAFKYFHRIDDPKKEHYLYQALVSYNEWGALGIVRHLLEKYGHCLGEMKKNAQSLVVSTNSSGGVLARSRIEKLMSSSKHFDLNDLSG